MKIVFTTFYDPNYLGIRYLAAVLKQAGHEVKILQLKDIRHRILTADNVDKHTGYYLFSSRIFSSSGDSEFPITPTELDLFKMAISRFDPDIVGFTNRSPYNHLLPIVLPAIRQAAPNAFIVGGGFGPTLEPEISLGLGANAVVRGEGEETIVELAAALEKDLDWTRISNMAYLSGGAISKNPLRPLLTDLDSLPFPLYYGNHFISVEDDKISFSDMRHQSQGGVLCKNYVVLTARGCIGHCSYCAGGNWRNQYRNEGLNAPLIRPRSMANVMDELRFAKANGEKFIYFSDEYLVRKSDILQKFFEEYHKEIDLPFFAHMNHKQLMEVKGGRRPLLEAVKKAGLRTIPVGVQSASEKFARDIYHRKNTNKEIIEAINTFADYGFSGNYHIIGGNLLETKEDIEALYDFAAKIPFDPSLKTDWPVHSGMLRILQGSPLAEEHPELSIRHYPPQQYSEIILLAEIRNKVDRKTFEDIRNNPFYKGNPARLHQLLDQIIRDRHMQYLANEISRLKDKEVWFWGASEMYQYKAHLFADTRPRGILVDTIEKGMLPRKINGLEVNHPDEKLLTSEPVPIIAFTGNPNKICRTIANKYPRYTDIVACARL